MTLSRNHVQEEIFPSVTGALEEGHNLAARVAFCHKQQLGGFAQGHFPPNTSLVPTSQGTYTYTSNPFIAQLSPFRQAQVMIMENCSEQGHEIKWIKSSSPTSTPPCNSWWRRAQRRPKQQRRCRGSVALCWSPCKLPAATSWPEFSKHISDLR